MPKIFISHSSKDKSLAKQIATDIRKAGHEVWLDEWEILVGDSIVQKIQHGLKDSDYVAVLLSNNSIASGWVEKEWQSKVGDEAALNNVIILPLLLDNCGIPLLLRDKRYADFRYDYESAINELLRSISHRSNRSGQIYLNAKEHYQAPSILTENDDSSSEVATIFIENYKKSSWDIRRDIIHGIAKLPMRSPSDYQVLALGLLDGDSDVQATAQEVLASCGFHKAMLPLLSENFTKKSWNIRRDILNAIASCGPSGAVAGNITALGILDDDSDVRTAAQKAFASCGFDVSCLPPLMENFAKKSWDIRRDILNAIASSKPPNTAISLVKLGLTDNDSDVRQAAQNAISSISS